MSGFLRTASTVLSIAATVVTLSGNPALGTALAAGAALTGTAAQVTAKKPSNERQGAQVQFKIDPGAPLSYVMGRTAVGGTLVHRETYGTDNSYQTWFVDLGAGGPYDAIEQFTADRAAVALSGTSALGYYANWLWQDQQLGQTPEPRALTNGIGRPPYGFAGQVPGWSDAHRMSGHAAASVSFLYDTKARRYAQGEPKPGWVLRGAKVYDPAQDSTYPGGSGPCRWADPSNTAAHAAARATWVYSDSPALHGLMWRLGIWQRDETNLASRYQKIMGIGAPIDLIDLPAIIHARNIQVANGWRVSGEVTSAQDKWGVLKLIEQAGGCEPISVGALMSTLIKAPRVPLRTITAADLADGTLSAPAMRARSERINGYRARFRSEPHGWEMTSIDIVQVPTYVTEDGRAKTGSGDFSLVTDPDQCAELAAYEVFDSREIEPIVVPLKPFAVAYRLGDCLTLDLPEIGLEAREAVVRGRSVDPATGIVTLTLRSETAGKHPACLGQTGETPPTPTLTAAPDSIAAPGEGAWTLVAGTGTADGLIVPALVITGAVDNSNADGVLIEWRRIGDGQWQSAGLLAPDTQARTIAPVDAETAYEVAIRYRGRGIYSLARFLGPVTTGAASADWSTGVTGPNKPDDNATNSADPSSPLGPVGTVADALAVLARVEPIELDLAGVERATVDHDAAIRQADRARAQLAASGIADLLADHSQRITLRDAGFVVDQASGRAYIYGVDQNNRRVSKVEVDLNAVTGQLALRATYNDVAVAIAQAQLSPGQAAEFGAIIARLNTVEISLASQAAAIALKADAITVQALGVTLQTAVQSIDALNGLVQQRVTYADFNPFRDKVGVVEQTLLSLGDVSSYGLTIRQAELRNTAAAAAGLAGLLATHEGQQRDVVRAAELQQQFTTSLTEAGAALAATRFALSAQIGEAMAGLVEERSARVTADTAQAKRTDLLTVTVGEQSALLASQGQALASETEARTLFGQQITARIKAAEDETARVDGQVTAQVSRLDTAVADANGARASAITQLRLETGEALLLVDDRVDGVVDRAGAIEATRTFAVDANGRVSGWRFVGGANGGRLLLIDADLYLDDGLIVSSAGGFDVRRGAGFGTTGNLIEWFGPTNVALGAETIANSRWALATDGKRYNGGIDLDTIGSAPGRIRQVSVSSNTGTSGTDTKVVDTKQMTLPAGGALRITGRINTASAAPANGDIAGGWVLRFYLDFGGGPVLLAEAACSVPTDGSGIGVDGLAALAGQLFPNPGSGNANLTVTSQRSPPPNSGIAATWTGSATVEWVNA